MAQYIDSCLFDTIPHSYLQDHYYEAELLEKRNQIRYIQFFLMKHIKESKDNNYIIVVPITSIANDFYIAFDYKEDSTKLCINDGTF